MERNGPSVVGAGFDLEDEVAATGKLSDIPTRDRGSPVRERCRAPTARVEPIRGRLSPEVPTARFLLRNRHKPTSISIPPAKPVFTPNSAASVSVLEPKPERARSP